MPRSSSAARAKPANTPRLRITPKLLRKALDDLPASPAVIGRIRKLDTDPNAGLSDFADAISLDGSVAARVLRIVNSAYYGLPQKVVDLKRAAAFLGTEEIARIVLGVSIAKAFERAGRKVLERFWEHSVHVALASQALARQLEPTIDPDEAWTTGLLHDVGQLVLAVLFAEHFEAVHVHAEENGVTFLTAEAELCMPSHARLGVVLCERWQLPPLFGKVIAGTHDSPGAPSHESPRVQAFTRVVAVADSLVQLSDGGLCETSIAQRRAELTMWLGEDPKRLVLAASTVHALRDKAQALAALLR